MLWSNRLKIQSSKYFARGSRSKPISGWILYQHFNRNALTRNNIMFIVGVTFWLGLCRIFEFNWLIPFVYKNWFVECKYRKQADFIFFITKIAGKSYA